MSLKIMSIYYVIECRGCGIQYIANSGTLEECQAFSAALTGAAHSQKSLPQHEKTLWNGNGEPFSYEIISADRYDQQELNKYELLIGDIEELE
jgi:hypothetical protein